MFTLDVRTVLSQWRRLKRIPGGRALFSASIGLVAPYSGSIGARIEDLGPGSSRIRLKDARRIRNHLSSVHAAALANLAELTGSLALLASLPPASRMIVKSLHV